MLAQAFLLLFPLLAQAGGDLYFQQPKEKRIQQTRYFTIYAKAEMPAADDSRADQLPCSRSEYKRKDRVDPTRLQRAVEAIQKEVEPRLDSFFSQAEAQAWKKFFPVPVYISLGMSPLCANTGNKGVEVGDRFSPEQVFGWSQVLTHETGHAIWNKQGWHSPFWDEFFADFFSWSVFDFDPQMFQGFNQEINQKYKENLNAGEISPTLFRLWTAMEGPNSGRDFRQKPDLSLVFKYPEHYVVSKNMNALLVQMGNPKLVSRALFNRMEKSGHELTNDPYLFAHMLLQELKILDPAFATKAEASARASFAAAFSNRGFSAEKSTLSLRDSFKLLWNKGKLEVQVYPAPEFLRQLSYLDEPAPALALLNGKTVMNAFSTSQAGGKIFDLSKSESCATDEFTQRLNEKDLLQLEVVTLTKGGTLEKEILDLSFVLREAQSRFGSKKGCWMVNF